ncbi:MAG: acyltransferase [Bacteroidaceae bacterium]|nr:acyltransferase [Bacteroidaceae bacterium]
MSVIGSFLGFCRRVYWSGKFGSVDGKITIGKNVTFQNPDTLHFGKGVTVGKNSYFLPLKRFAGIDYTPKITVGDRCWIGIRNSFACINSIEIGNDVLFAGYVHITDHSHGFEDIDTPVMKQPLTSKGGVVIEDECWLGFGCEILSGVHIGRHSVVAAHAVVTKDVPPFSVVAGNPAKIIKQYDPETKEWKSVK